MITRVLQPSVTVSTNPTYIRLDLLSGNQAFCHKRAYSLTTILQQLCLRAIFERSTSNLQTINERSTSDHREFLKRYTIDTTVLQNVVEEEKPSTTNQPLGVPASTLPGIQRKDDSLEKSTKGDEEKHADSVEVCSVEEHDQTLPRTNTNQERRDPDEERIGAER